MRRRSGICAALLAVSVVQVASSADNSKTNKLVATHRISSSHRAFLKSAGDRYEKEGKERLILVGTAELFSNGVKSSTLRVRVTLEFPDRLKIENLENGERVNFDGAVSQKSAGGLSKQDLDLAESLLSDSTDGFFAALLHGAAAKTIGSYYQLSPMDKSAYCSLVQLRDVVKVRNESQSSVKVYCFDSQTGKLRSVRYASGGSAIETGFADWMDVAGQPVPRKVVRLENGKQTIVVSITAASMSTTAADGFFSKP